jgi:hypothetical protein
MCKYKRKCLYWIFSKQERYYATILVLFQKTQVFWDFDPLSVGE